MVNLADHVEIKDGWRIIPANVQTVSLVSDRRTERSRSQAHEDFFVFLAKTLFDGPMVPSAGPLGGNSWLEDGYMHYYCPTSDFQVPADFMAETGVVEDHGNQYRLPVPLERLEDHARASVQNLRDHDTMVAHALTVSFLFWDETRIWTGLQAGDFLWNADSPERRAYRYLRAREELDLIPSMHVLGLVDFVEADGHYIPTPELNRVSDLVV